MLVLLITLGFFSKFHPSDGDLVSKRHFVSAGENLSVIASASQNFAADSMLFHTCHAGHAGCLFIFTTVENLFSYNLQTLVYTLQLQTRYSSPNQEQPKRPPIS